MAQHFTITPNSPNPYITCTVNNMDLIITLNNERENWMKKYHKIIRELETMTNIQHQLQSIIQLAEVVNTQLVEIKTTILQASNIMKAYHMQKLLTNKLDRCKGRENAYANNYIKEIQDTY